MMPSTVTLPAGKKEITVSEIPWMIAEAITPPDQAATVCITAIKKIYTSPDTPDDYQFVEIEKLTEDDWKYLDIVFGLAELPPLRQGKELVRIPLAKWEAYEKALEEHKPKWQLKPCSNTVLNIVESQHRQRLNESIQKGEVVACDGLTRLPLQQPISLFKLQGAYMSVSGFIAYAEKYGVHAQVGEMGGEQANAPDANTTIIVPKNVTPSGLLTLQEEAILNWFKKNKINPLKCPVSPLGTGGVSKMCREGLQEENMQLYSQLFKTLLTFKNAYQRLRDNAKIIDVK